MTKEPLRRYPGLALLPEHEALLAASAIGPEVARARGYRSVTDPDELQRLGFAPAQRRPGLLVPIFDVFGNVDYQIRPDEPRVDERGRVIKYEIPAGHCLLIDVHPAQRDRVRDPNIPLVIVEGIRKADSITSNGPYCAIALLGVFGWRGTNEFGGLTTLPDWEGIALKGRVVYIAFDADPETSS